MPMSSENSSNIAHGIPPGDLNRFRGARPRDSNPATVDAVETGTTTSRTRDILSRWRRRFCDALIPAMKADFLCGRAVVRRSR